MVVCVFLFQLGSGSFQISATSTPSTQLQLPTLLIILLGLIFAIALSKLGLDDMALALAADRRERASDDFLKQHFRRAPRKGSILRTTGICVSLE
jgi:hypothetical protein